MFLLFIPVDCNKGRLGDVMISINELGCLCFYRSFCLISRCFLVNFSVTLKLSSVNLSTMLVSRVSGEFIALLVLESLC